MNKTTDHELVDNYKTAAEYTFTETVHTMNQKPSCDKFSRFKSYKVDAHAQSCLTLCDPMDCSLQSSSVQRMFQARVMEQVTISFSRDLPDPGIEPTSR